MAVTIIIKQTAKDMALKSLNSKETNFMKPEHKKAAAKGLEKPEKVLY